MIYYANLLSPSMRRVWIEIAENPLDERKAEGHPPCGGCGLKYGPGNNGDLPQLSPSMRRVWIEIPAGS